MTFTGGGLDPDGASHAPSLRGAVPDGLFAEEMGSVPAVEVADTAEAVEVPAALPGMTPADVEVHLENNVLTIRGEKKEAGEGKETEHDRYERFYGSFQRAFALPVLVEESMVNAEFKNGVLKIHLPRTAESNGMKISLTARAGRVLPGPRSVSGRPPWGKALPNGEFRGHHVGSAHERGDVPCRRSRGCCGGPPVRG
jgi:HSP20 family molecular chaperone IbpA